MSVETKKNDNLWVLILFAIIGLALLTYGLVQVAKTFTYSKTIGQFSHSSLETSTDSDGNTSTYYIWYYDFYVNNTKYVAKSDSKNSYEPNNKEEKILYNPENPTENLPGTNYERYYPIIFGILFLGSVFVCKPKRKIDQNEEKTNTFDSNGAWYVVVFFGAIFLIILMQADFNIVTLLTMGLFPIMIIVILGIVMGIFLVKKAKNPQIQSNDNIDNINELSDSSNYVIDEEQVEKIKNITNVITGIRIIIIGIIWCIFSFGVQIISAIMVLFSLFTENPTYTYNGREVTAIEFIFGSISFFQLIAFSFGVIIIVLGIKSLHSSKQESQ